MDKEQAIQNILNDLEYQPLQKSRTFQAYLNQPELISLSSTNAEIQSAPINPQTNNSYYNFTVNLPRPAINAKSLQLLKAIIPQAQCSIPDYSLVFPYYYLRTVPIDENGTLFFIDTPQYYNLLFIRLLPSYYKPELINLSTTENFDKFGWNRTFNDYEELLTEINKACVNDPIYDYGDGAEPSYFHYIPENVSFIFDTTLNKFVFRGLKISTPNVYNLWDFDLIYNVNDIVLYDGIVYICLQYNSETLPSANPAYWKNISQYFTEFPHFKAYFVAGYQDPNVKTLLKDIQIDSTDYDAYLATSIPGNIYVENQTLARRLGFTWNGVGMITDTINEYVKNGLTYGGTGALFYNRIRPFPNYDYGTMLGLRFNPATGSSDTYTADGYCNLVYSSIISIYTIIVGTSSVDTQRNANLLAMLEMNCGNLGVAMASSFIDTKLTKIQSDIYSIYIELRDENGQPYYLTNNATTTVLLKLTYD